MPLPLEFVEAVASANLKMGGEQPLQQLAVLNSDAQFFRNQLFAASNQHYLTMNQLSTAVTAKAVGLVMDLDPAEGYALGSIDPAVIQTRTKTSQTTPPVTAS